VIVYRVWVERDIELEVEARWGREKGNPKIGSLPADLLRSLSRSSAISV